MELWEDNSGRRKWLFNFVFLYKTIQSNFDENLNSLETERREKESTSHKQTA